jgi:uracil phosphoribosyltransferase
MRRTEINRRWTQIYADNAVGASVRSYAPRILMRVCSGWLLSALICVHLRLSSYFRWLLVSAKLLDSGSWILYPSSSMLRLLNHPLGAHVMTHLRDRTTKPVTFRTLTYQIGLLLALESTRNLQTKETVIETPLETYRGAVLGDSLVLVPILRAAIGLVQPFTDLFPDVSIGYVGLERDHETAIARNYYCKLPPLAGRHVLIVDPMLATGGSAVQTVRLVQENGGQNISVVCVVAAPEGVKAVEAVDPSIQIFAAALDRELNALKYILPGLGDYGDRLYGT